MQRGKTDKSLGISAKDLHESLMKQNTGMLEHAEGGTSQLMQRGFRERAENITAAMIRLI